MKNELSVPQLTVEQENKIDSSLELGTPYLPHLVGCIHSTTQALEFSEESFSHHFSFLFHLKTERGWRLQFRENSWEIETESAAIEVRFDLNSNLVLC